MEETPQIESNTTEIILDNQQLVEAVRKQVEYYFSKENLQSDAYLTSQMDAQMTVPISVVMKFAKMKALTQDESVLRLALENSTITQVVGDKIKANIKSAGRSTIILREIPSDTPVDEVREIFNYEGCKTIGAIRSDIGDSWFVAMDSEEEAKDTLFDLRLKKRTFRGQAVKARLKTETVIRSFYPLQSAPAVPVGYAPMAFPGQIMDLRSFGYALPAEGQAAVDGSAELVDGKSDADATLRKDGKDTRNHKGPQSGVTGGKSGNPSKKVEPNNNSRVKTAASSSSKKEPVIEINSANFPPLPAGEDTPVPTPGYKETYVKYSFEEIISIVKEVKEAVLPASLNPTNHPFALTATPNLDLLKKQRTYSIDETREQLRQGRPVHREAITAGAVDYRSLMYGDDGQQIPSGSSATVAHTSTTAQHATVTSEPAAPVHTPSKQHHPKSRSNSHSDGFHGQTPKKISASSWAAMVKSSAAATAAVETESPVKTQSSRPVASATKPPVAGEVSKKTAVVVKCGDRKKPASSKEGVSKGAAPVDAGKRDRKKTVSAKEGGAKVESAIKDNSGAVETVTVTSSEETVVDQQQQAVKTTSTAPVVAAAAEGATKAPWGGKTSFASIVKLKSDEVEIPVVKVVSVATDPVVVKKAVSASAGRPHTSGAPNKTAGSNRTGAGGARTSSAGGSKEGERRARPSGPAGAVSPEGGHRKSSAGAAGTTAASSTTSTGGANSSGVWAREVLPSLPKK